ncbi:hypothetical protein [Mangrovivirga cuniculi]|uniref:Uncharacterized protein n=1 Tax=Mangrovivirga cuniculi TaxID=2715131 RepID=A0A4D7JH41_9BACT|nr:hypothetical protein [Mangrovivirga cuniculi]QCK14383.1 hypothetical protein DCC35_06320 [Mangrovivirga cuniculi]
MKALINHRIFFLKVISLFVLLLMKVQPNKQMELTEVKNKPDTINIKKGAVPVQFPKTIAVSKKDF